MGARTFELDIVTDEAALLAAGWLSVDHEAFPLAKRIAYSTIRRPITPPQALKNASYALVAADNGALIVGIAGLTITVPIAGALGTGFRCTFYADGATMTVTRSGGGSVTLVSGEMLVLMTVNNKVVTYKTPTVSVL